MLIMPVQRINKSTWFDQDIWYVKNLRGGGGGGGGAHFGVDQERKFVTQHVFYMVVTPRSGG